MDFKPSTIKGMFETSMSFAIPIYQRAYSWTKENWSVFLGDISEQSARANVYSYGNLLLETIEEDSKYEIIDGQQRLTTLIIFMRAMINVLRAKGYDEETLKDYERDFIVRKGTIKLRPVDNDRPCFDAIIVQNIDYKVNSASQKCMRDAKVYFERELTKLEVGELEKVVDVVLKTKINRLELKGKKESALMFELQNNRGRDLTNLERLKSYFMYQMYVNSTAEETEMNVELVSDNFKDIYKTIYDIQGLDEDSILIYHCNAYLQVAYAYRNLDNIKNEFLSAKDRVEWIKTFTHELALTFGSLKELQGSRSRYYERLKAMGRRNGTMASFVYPFIIKGYKYLNGDEMKLDGLLHIMEILEFRYHLVGSRADLNSRLSEIIRGFNGDVIALRDSLKKKLNDSWYWGDARTKEVLNGWMYENPMLHYILWQYEDSLQNKGYSIGTCEIEKEQIEHISPQNPPTGEALATGYDVTEENVYTEDFRNKKLNCIGNLVLISGSHNASIGNRPFSEKLESYKSNPLLKQQAEIATYLTDGIVEWKTAQIDARKKSIVDFAVKHWGFDEVEV